MERSQRGGILVLVLVGAVSCSDPTLRDAGGDGGGADAAVGDSGVADIGTDVSTAPGTWNDVTGETDPPTGYWGDTHIQAVGSRIVIINGDAAKPRSRSFDGKTWQTLSTAGLPTSLPLGCGSAISLGATMLVYGRCYGTTELFSYDETAGWKTQGSGGGSGGYPRMARIDGDRILVAGGFKPSPWWTWSKASGWALYAPPPKSPLADASEGFMMFNLGSATFAAKAGKTYAWSVSPGDWSETGVPGAPGPSSSTAFVAHDSERWATDDGGKRTFLLVANQVHIFDGSKWQRAGGTPCDADRIPKGIASIASSFYLFCAPSASASSAPWITRRWSD